MCTSPFVCTWQFNLHPFLSTKVIFNLLTRYLFIYLITCYNLKQIKFHDRTQLFNFILYIYISYKFHNLVLRTFSYHRFVNKLFNVNKLGILNRITSHLSFWGTFKVSNIISKTLIWLTRCPPYTVFFQFKLCFTINYRYMACASRSLIHVWKLVFRHSFGINSQNWFVAESIQSAMSHLITIQLSLVTVVLTCY